MFLKNLNFQNIFKSLKDVIFRFPISVAIAITTTILMIYIIEIEEYYSEKFNLLSKLAFLSAMSISLFIVVQLLIEKFKFKRFGRININITALAYIYVYYALLPDKLFLNDIYRIILLGLSLHLFIAFIPYFKKSDENLNFWNYNKILFIRVLTSALYSSVLYIGIALAILGISQLFKIDFDGKIYAQLWFIIVGIFNTFIILSGIPKSDSKNYENYPIGLKIFAQYILLPLVSLYFVILYAYTFKIIINWELPYGWVSYLVIFYSSIGIFTFLLLYPLVKPEINKFLWKFFNVFFILLFPLIVLLFIAIITRISHYGITENRYYVIALAIWFLLISIYLLINRLKNIKIIPLTLAIFTILSIFGPFSSFNISKNSQLDRFEKILSDNNLLSNEKIIKAPENLEFDVKKDISSIVEYIVDNHGHKYLSKYFSQNLDSLCSDTTYCNRTYDILNLMGIEYIYRYASVDTYANSYFYFTSDFENFDSITPISEYDYFYYLVSYTDNETKDDSIAKIKSFDLDSVKFNIYFDKNLMDLIFNINEDSLIFDIDKEIMKLESKHGNNSYKIPQDEMIYNIESKNYSIKLQFQNLSGNYNEEGSIKFITNTNSYIFIKRKNNKLTKIQLIP